MWDLEEELSDHRARSADRERVFDLGSGEISGFFFLSLPEVRGTTLFFLRLLNQIFIFPKKAVETDSV
jgi:hypothetical protein